MFFARQNQIGVKWDLVRKWYTSWIEVVIINKKEGKKAIRATTTKQQQTQINNAHAPQTQTMHSSTSTTAITTSHDNSHNNNHNNTNDTATTSVNVNSNNNINNNSRLTIKSPLLDNDVNTASNNI
jgi:hypothetical protein